jgi:selenocysteine lyase/cysteine desulfurase
VEDSGLHALVRAEFPHLGDCAYLDAACIGIAAQRTVDAVTDFVRRAQSLLHPTGTARHGWFNAARLAARPLVATFIGAEVDDIALVESTTHGLALAAQTLKLGQGDKVAMCDLEFLQMGVVWSRLQRQGVQVVPIHTNNGYLSVDMVRNHLGDGVKVLALSSVQWANGFRADVDAIAALCRKRGVWLVIDAAQHLGALQFDVRQTPVDVLCCGGHKWLNSPFGQGFLYVSPRVREHFDAPMPGFFAAKSPNSTWGESFLIKSTSPFQDFHFFDSAAKWEIGGTANWSGGIALGAAVSLIQEIGSPRIEHAIHALTDRLIEGLDRLDIPVVSHRAPERRSGIVTFTLGSPVADGMMMEYLATCGVSVSARYTSGVGGVRVSCHYFNTDDDVDRLLEAAGTWVQSKAKEIPVGTRAHVSALPLLDDLEPEDVAAVVKAFGEHLARDGDVLVSSGSPAPGLAIIVSGEASALKDGREVGRLVRGDIFGEISALLNEPTTATVVASGDVRYLLLPAPIVEQFLTDHPKFCYRLLQAEARRVRDL